MRARRSAAVTRASLPTLWCRPLLLGQLFQNLIANAIKYRAASPPQIHVAAERGADEWVFSVRDNGIGVPPQYRERIFQIFRRGPGAEELPGQGLGLAICQRIVERHGGRIWVEPADGGGSVFRFTIPDEVPGVAIAPES